MTLPTPSSQRECQPTGFIMIDSYKKTWWTHEDGSSLVQRLLLRAVSFHASVSHFFMVLWVSCSVMIAWKPILQKGELVGNKSHLFKGQFMNIKGMPASKHPRRAQIYTELLLRGGGGRKTEQCAPVRAILWCWVASVVQGHMSLSLLLQLVHQWSLAFWGYFLLLTRQSFFSSN